MTPPDPSEPSNEELIKWAKKRTYDEEKNPLFGDNWYTNEEVYEWFASRLTLSLKRIEELKDYRKNDNEYRLTLLDERDTALKSIEQLEKRLSDWKEHYYGTLEDWGKTISELDAAQALLDGAKGLIRIEPDCCPHNEMIDTFCDGCQWRADYAKMKNNV